MNAAMECRDQRNMRRVKKADISGLVVSTASDQSALYQSRAELSSKLTRDRDRVESCEVDINMGRTRFVYLIECLLERSSGILGQDQHDTTSSEQALVYNFLVLERILQRRSRVINREI